MVTTEVVNQDVAQAICQSQLEKNPCAGECGITLVESLAVSADAVPEREPPWLINYLLFVPC